MSLVVLRSFITHFSYGYGIVADDTSSISTAAKVVLQQRKESRDKHKADFRAFVNARRQRREGDAADAPDAAPPLRLDVPLRAPPADALPRSTPPVGKRSPRPAGSDGAEVPPPKSNNKASADLPARSRQGKAFAGPSTGASRRSRNSNASPVPQSPHSVVSNSSASSVPSLQSPRPDAAGFIGAEFRSQREAQLNEMRHLMLERRQQLRKAVRQQGAEVEGEVEVEVEAEVDVLAQSIAPPLPTPPVIGATPSSPGPRPGLMNQRSTESMDADQSRLFAHLQDSTAGLLAGASDHNAPAQAAGATLLEYSVLIEQMQAILRAPDMHRHAVAPVTAEHQSGQYVTPSPTAAGRGVGPVETAGRTGRALMGDLLLEGAGAEDNGADDVQEAPTEVGRVGAGPADADGVLVEEDSDEFEEEEDPVVRDAALLLQQEEGLAGLEGEECGSEFGSSQEDLGEGDEGEEDEAELLTFPEHSSPQDPFLQPLVPSLLTADALLLMDPLRHALQRAVPGGAAAVPVSTPPARGASGEQDSPRGEPPQMDAAEAERRLRVAELQEYLVSKLGSAKVSQALHLLAVNTAATLTPGAGEDDYDERDEELLNRLEDILGSGSLHYLDDMFLLLTLQ
jgi:hypothetical protein